jgi:hypothetical protein
MSYEVKRGEYSKEHINVIELEADYCANTFGLAPCTATGSGDAKCVNTFNNCQDKNNFTKTTKVYRFCEDRSPHPIGIDAIPNLLSVNISPTTIDLKGGLGVRASINCTFKDHPHSDIGIDPYVDERTFIASERGSFWTKWRARNPNYQFRKMRHLSGYLVDGVFDANNFITRHYIIDSVNVSGGKASITGKDPLKLTSSKKAQAPKPSNGKLVNPINPTDTSLTLTAGTGVEYPTSGKVLIRSEVISYSGKTGDQLTGLTRGENNTVAEDHSVGDTVQLCLEYTAQQVHLIVEDLLVNYANIDPSYISIGSWQSEIDTYLSGLLNGIIVKPFDVFKLLQELAEAMPHYLWWDERLNQIQLTALKAPQAGSDVIDMDGNITADSFSTKDKPEMRVNTVYVNFGQFNPVKKLDEPDNYQATYVRADADSIANYGSDEVKVINTRWLSQNNEAAARQLAALIGRRFADVPREIGFKLEPKDGDVWTGQTRTVNHRDIVDDNGLPLNTDFQIMSSRESDLFEYKALEFTYGGSLPEDEGGGEPGVDLVFIPADATNINLRTLYDAQYPAPDATTIAKFILDNGRKCGSTSTASYAIDTGTWPAGAVITLQTNASSVAAGAGGDGGNGNGNTAGLDGGDCLILNYDLELINNGILGGGGGGGSYGENTIAGGGGGAGYIIGLGGVNDSAPNLISSVAPEDGGTLSGGSGGVVTYEPIPTEPAISTGGKGGDLGQAGESVDGATSGAAGVAINRNGFTLTQTVPGDIRGAIVG